MNWIKQEIRDLDRSPRALRKFGFTVGGALAVLAVVSELRHGHAGLILFALAGLVPLAGWLAPRFLTRFFVVWMTFAIVLGWIITRIILTVLFFCVLTPIGMLQRLFGKSPIKLVIQKSRATYWQARLERPVHLDYERQF